MVGQDDFVEGHLEHHERLKQLRDEKLRYLTKKGKDPQDEENMNWKERAGLLAALDRMESEKSEVMSQFEERITNKHKEVSVFGDEMVSEISQKKT